MYRCIRSQCLLPKNIMIIIGLSDIHNDVSRLADIAEDLCKADIVVISGDVTNFGGKTDAASVINELRIYNRNVLAVPGNCDPEEVSEYLNMQQINLDRMCRIVGGAAFVGIGGSLPCPGKTPNEISEFEFRKHLEIAAKPVAKTLPLVLVTHQPPYGTNADCVAGSRHVGSESIREFIVEDRPAVCFCGHIHEARSVDYINLTAIINPGPFKHGGYGYVELNGTVTTAELRGI
jgi:Icc-related predicted phosphoesterase